MTLWRLPPQAKVYEALTAVADGRVQLTLPDQAEVRSSGGDKTYTVAWSDDLATVTSNDNASYWQGYLGYPIVAVLITLGKVRVDDAIVPLLASVRWNELNARFKRDYDAAVEHVLTALEQRGADRRHIVKEVDGVMAQLAALKLERRGRGRRPPRSG
jgi:hypothetical protein